MKTLTTALLLTFTTTSFFFQDASAGHGGGNGGDPKELFLHNQLQIAVDYLGSAAGSAKAELNSEDIAELARIIDRVHFRVSADFSECITKDPQLPILTVSLKPDCFDRLSKDRGALYPSLYGFVLDQFMTPQEREAFGEMKLNRIRQVLSDTHPNEISASRRFVRHTTCELEVARSMRTQGARREDLRKALLDRGYDWISRRSKDRITLGVQSGELMLLDQGSSSSANKSERLFIHLNSMEGTELLNASKLNLEPLQMNSGNALRVMTQIRKLPWCWKNEFARPGDGQ